MKFGCPIASSNRGSLPEVGGEAVDYFDPRSDMTQVIDSLLRSPKRRAQLSKLGVIRAKTFTWENTARLTHQVYEKILSSHI